MTTPTNNSRSSEALASDLRQIRRKENQELLEQIDRRLIQRNRECAEECRRLAAENRRLLELMQRDVRQTRQAIESIAVRWWMVGVIILILLLWTTP